MEYSKWEKIFAWLPIKTVSGQTVWCKYVYRRQRKPIGWNPPHYPPKDATKFEYETIENIIARKLSGE